MGDVVPIHIMLQQSGKYFYASCREAGGIDSKICDLEIIINIALSMKRIPIIRESKVSVMYNTSAEKVPIDWERYINLAETRILRVEQGRIKELPNSLQYIHERDFDFDAYSKKQIRHIDEDQLYDKENESYPIICLSNTKNSMNPRGITPQFYEKSDYPKKVDTGVLSSFLAIFLPSREVNDLTDIVLNCFGTERTNLKSLSDILYSHYRLYNGNDIYRRNDLNYYACINVQSERNCNFAAILMNKYRIKNKVKKAIRKTQERWRKKVPFYIMSNIMETNYFNFLKSKYDIYRYTNFKELEERLVQDGVIDYNLLYMVESNIMRHALIKVFPDKMNRFVIEGPWSLPGFGQPLEKRMKRYIYSIALSLPQFNTGIIVKARVFKCHINNIVARLQSRNRA